MTVFFSRRGVGAEGRKPTVSIRVGQVYLDTRRRKTYCLNEVARQLLHEGVPLSGTLGASSSLRTLEGEPIQAADLPMLRAWRQQAPQECSYLFSTSEGQPCQLIWSAAPLADAAGVSGILCSLTVAPLEPDWQQLAGLAHDLRTPLQALRLLMPLLENTAMQSEERSLLQRLRECADRTLALGMDLLEWARGPLRGGRRVENAWFALEPVLRALADEQAIQAQSKAIAWQTDFAAARGLEVQADRVRLGRLLSNLMNNAIRYTPRGEVRVAAAWRTGETAGHPLLVLSIEDTGRGISPADQESIFQPFERGQSAREGDSDGSGMGLAVVDRLVEELGLTLEVASECGQGSKFEVLLPPQRVRSL